MTETLRSGRTTREKFGSDVYDDTFDDLSKGWGPSSFSVLKEAHYRSPRVATPHVTARKSELLEVLSAVSTQIHSISSRSAAPLAFVASNEGRAIAAITNDLTRDYGQILGVWTYRTDSISSRPDADDDDNEAISGVVDTFAGNAKAAVDWSSRELPIKRAEPRIPAFPSRLFE